jgi:hypothetical protein
MNFILFLKGRGQRLRKRKLHENNSRSRNFSNISKNNSLTKEWDCSITK